jgi:hypothetical protein
MIRQGQSRPSHAMAQISTVARDADDEFSFAMWEEVPCHGFDAG